LEGNSKADVGGLAPQPERLGVQSRGGEMRRLLVAVGLLVSTLLLVCGLSGQGFKFENQQVKERQKAEMKALKLKHKYAKESLKGQDIPKALRTQMHNEMKREEQTLRQKHEHEMEVLKDRQRVLTESQPG